MSACDGTMGANGYCLKCGAWLASSTGTAHETPVFGIAGPDYKAIAADWQSQAERAQAELEAERAAHAETKADRGTEIAHRDQARAARDAALATVETLLGAAHSCPSCNGHDIAIACGTCDVVLLGGESEKAVAVIEREYGDTIATLTAERDAAVQRERMLCVGAQEMLHDASPLARAQLEVAVKDSRASRTAPAVASKEFKRRNCMPAPAVDAAPPMRMIPVLPTYPEADAHFDKIMAERSKGETTRPLERRDAPAVDAGGGAREAAVNWLVRHFTRDLLNRHPLPWSIDRDWTTEIRDANGQIVTKVITVAQAETLIATAIEVDADDKRGEAEMKKILTDEGIT